ncbi:hypothetical protein PtrSN002B_004308 [Pyrenophora tritici-repentis]|uniref:DUF1421 multi-domain protein n=2 Tax=Pyrenophora tritici-repentis TaxID=45151 RepID=A0A2W1EBG6_9PLEO|nr:uncharacterized protein PTRG_03809 [Pyrenophora tritici-repentis Pt-1C-BFP]KAA8620137.1 hypothetical protein PtrV1_07231 [Pyrenophora tritici-repentis]EDU46647.1 conserved hypothetical protein [Pyrenophora tritici-repentis Pt-1C-BFP]KAF7448287.1 hypothetical protein A1F99_076510 [Pyrenophora tritici-repentis]KAF7572005.1 DUF1421 multi-domain protein [Pyrenophora tritici-repentis]KAI0579994.1 hypothetical protein Alg215_05480 [Pyrenophora tritici-repentis]
MPFLYETEPYNLSPPTATYTTSNPNIITFLLIGRTTLSEHSPSEKISVDYEIAYRSPYLRNFLPSQALSSSSCTLRHLPPITLPSIDPAAFTIYISYLATSRITLSLPSHHSLSLYACVDLLYAHMLGTVIRAPHFQDAVIDHLTEVLDTVQAPDVRVLEMLYLEEGVSDVLRGFVGDVMFGWEKRMLGALRGGGGEGVGVKTEGSGLGRCMGCKYHVHEGGVCYKDLEEEERDVEMGDGKKWCIEDDEEMNAMAAHYLGKKSMKVEGVLIHLKTQGSSMTVDRKGTRQDMPRPKGPQPMRQAVSTHTRTVSTKTTSSYQTVDLYLTKPLPSLPQPELDDIHYFDPQHVEHKPTTLLERNFSLTPLPKLTRYPTPPASPPRSPSVTVTLHPNPFAQNLQPILPRKSAPRPISPTLPRPYHIEAPPSLHFPPLIKRKPAPSRGQDWANQWDRLFAMRGMQGFGQRKVFEERSKSRGKWFADKIENMTARICERKTGRQTVADHVVLSQ